MYRIRSASGTEAVYNSLEEFAAAVRRGDVLPEDEIFHTRANRWLDVKSHPHYRSALSFQGHTAPAAPAPSAPVQAPTRPAPTPGHSNSQTRARVFERPTIRPPQQTTVRPQLQAAPRAQPAAVGSGSSGADAALAPPPVPEARPVTPAAPPAPRRPRKSKELTFIDVEEKERSSAPALKPVEAAEAPAQPAPQPKAVTRHETREPGPGTEVQFLVMDGAMESPVRNSAGTKSVPDDLDLLFDAPLPDQEAAANGSAAPANGSTAPAETQASAPEAGSEKAPAAAAAELVAPPVESASAPVESAPAPAEPAPAPAEPAAVSVEPVAVTVEPVAVTVEPVAVAVEPVAVPAEPAAVPAWPAAHVQAGDPPEEVVQETPAPIPHHTPFMAAAAAPGRSRSVLVAGGVALLAVVGTLLAWRPWQSSGPPAPTASVDLRPTAQPTPPPTPVATPFTPSAGDSEVGAKSGETNGGSRDSGKSDGVIAAVKPNFSAPVSLPSADLGLNPDLNSGGGDAAVPPSQLARRLEAAEQATRQELTDRLSSIHFKDVLSQNRLGTKDGVAAAQAAWSGGADAIRRYRAALARVDQAYDDSLLSSQRAQKWSPDEMRAWATRQSLAEPAETSQLGDLMFSQVGEGLDILAALQGQYEITDGKISFKNAASATRYTGIRNWVEQRTQSWMATPESARPLTVTMILTALGNGFPAIR